MACLGIHHNCAEGPHYEQHFCRYCEHTKDEIIPESPCYICFYGTVAEDCRFTRKDDKAATIKEAVDLILTELEKAQIQHPCFPTDPIHAVAIMVEEAGEAIQASLDFTYGGKHAEKLQKEIIQTGAMAVRNLINFHNFKAIKSL